MWKHSKKFKGKIFASSYEKSGKDRVFTLVYPGSKLAKSYESWQAAVKDGWFKVK